MKGALSMNTTIQEKNEPAFHAYLKKAQASPNTIRSCMAACRLYYSLYDDLTVNHLIFALRIILLITTKQPR